MAISGDSSSVLDSFFQYFECVSLKCLFYYWIGNQLCEQVLVKGNQIHAFVCSSSTVPLSYIFCFLVCYCFTHTVLWFCPGWPCGCGTLSVPWLVAGNRDMGYCTQLTQEGFNKRYLIVFLKQCLLYMFFNLLLTDQTLLSINAHPLLIDI